MLPNAAIIHFNNLCAADFAAGWKQLAEAQREFERKETGGRGAGYASRLGSLYLREFERRSQFVSATLREVHQTFGGSLGDAVLNQLLDLGARTLSDQLQAIEGAYIRHVQPFGLVGVGSGLGDQAMLQQAAVANGLRQHFWTLEHVPMKSDPNPQPNMTFNGPVGAVQTAPHSVANVSHRWSGENVTTVIDALTRLRELLANTPNIDATLSSDLLRDVDSAKVELALEQPNAGRVTRWLGGVGAVVQTVGALQPAWEAVRGALRTLGIAI